jgi:hypothetical protein
MNQLKLIMRTAALWAAVSAFFLFSGCSSTKQSANFLDLRIGIHQLTFSMPLIYLERLKNERTVADAEGNRAVFNELKKAVPSALSPKYAVSSDVSRVTAQYYDDIGKLFFRLDTTRDISSIRMGGDLRDHLNAEPDQYCIVLSLTGLSRPGGSVAFETFKSVMVGIFTLGLKVTVPIKANSTMAVAIVDREEGRVIYYDKNAVEENPGNQDIVAAQLNRVFKAFLK